MKHFTIKNCWYYDILKHSTKACNVNTSKDVDWKKKVQKLAELHLYTNISISTRWIMPRTLEDQRGRGSKEINTIKVIRHLDLELQATKHDRLIIKTMVNQMSINIDLGLELWMHLPQNVLLQRT